MVRSETCTIYYCTMSAYYMHTAACRSRLLYTVYITGNLSIPGHIIQHADRQGAWQAGKQGRYIYYRGELIRKEGGGTFLPVQCSTTVLLKVFVVTTNEN